MLGIPGGRSFAKAEVHRNATHSEPVGHVCGKESHKQHVSAAVAGTATARVIVLRAPQTASRKQLAKAKASRKAMRRQPSFSGTKYGLPCARVWRELTRIRVVCTDEASGGPRCRPVLSRTT